MTGVKELCFFLVAALGSTRISAQTTFHNSLLLADPNDCTIFYEFVPQVKQCPTGLVFNAQQQVCDWPANVNCACCNGGGDGSFSTTESSNGGGVTDSGNNGGQGTGDNGGGDGSSSTTESSNGSGATDNGNNGGEGTGDNGGDNGSPTTTESNNGNAGGEDNGNGSSGGTGSAGEGNCPARGTCPNPDPLDHTVHLPHRKNCSLFCRCDHGIPKLDYCPPGLHFNPQLQVCDYPQNAGCVPDICDPLSNNSRSHWVPSSCVSDSVNVGDKCQLVCNKEFELSGTADVTCTNAGWNGTMGINQLPTCKSVEETGEDFVNNINKTIGIKANLLFVLDESGSVSASNFQIELSFVKSIIKAFPLSKNRTAGLITFSSGANVDIPLADTDTCGFLTKVAAIRYDGGGTDIRSALQVSLQEIQRNAVHNLTLVFLITDGLSQTDPATAAQALTGSGNVLYTVGVANFSPTQLIPLSSVDDNGTPLFFGVKSFEVFNSLATYLETHYNTAAINC